MGDFGNVQRANYISSSRPVSKGPQIKPAIFKPKPAIPQRNAGFLQNVSARVKDDLNKVDKRLNQVFFPKGDYIKPSSPVKPISKDGMNHIKKIPTVPAVQTQAPIKPAVSSPASLVVSNGAILSKELPKQSAPVSPIAKAGIAAAIIGAGYFFLKG